MDAGRSRARRWARAKGTGPAIASAILTVTLVVPAGCSRDDGGSSAASSVTTSPADLRLDVAAEDRALAQAATWLWNVQSADGGWHSATYGLLESGQALTPFVLCTLLDVPDEVCSRPRHGVERALAWIRGSVNERGEVGLADPELPEYPNYATAYALLCLVRGGSEKDASRIALMRDHLVDQQFRANNGFGPKTVVYGGWGFGGLRPVGGVPGHMDVHHTRVVLQALRAAGVKDAQVFRRAEAFLRVVQKHPAVKSMRSGDLESAPFSVWNAPYDGGFYFSPVMLAANKGGMAGEGEETYYRSYASATCDGVLALLACGVAADNERIVHAQKWLHGHPLLDWPGGIPRDTNENWGESIRFTYYAVQAETMAALDWDSEGRRRLAELITKEQRSDGSFMNRVGFLMKEDDPLLCTALAVTALTAVNERAQRE